MMIKKYNADGSGKNFVPLRLIKDIQVVGRPSNGIVSLHLSQQSGEHDCQWGLTLEQAQWLYDNLGNALKDCLPGKR